MPLFRFRISYSSWKTLENPDTILRHALCGGCVHHPVLHVQHEPGTKFIGYTRTNLAHNAAAPHMLMLHLLVTILVDNSVFAHHPGCHMHMYVLSLTLD
jgi:hypothetical protein